MSTSTTRPARLPSLTGLRFFAAFAVFLFHVSLSAAPIPPNDPVNPFANPTVARTFENALLNAGYIGVSFFFVLSGFVLAWSARPGQAVLPFWRRRVVKIFPNHLVVFVLSLVLFAGVKITSVWHWLPNLFLVHPFFPQPEVNLSINPPSWSLGSELLFYLLFPFLIGPVNRIREHALWLWAGATVTGTVVLQLVVTHLIPDTPASAITPISDAQFWFGYLFPPGRLFEFFLGMVLARIVLAGRWPKALGTGWSLVLLAAGYGAGFLVPFQYTFVVATIIPIAVVIAATAVADVEGRQSFLASRPMVWFGEVSFGFYLVQGVTIFYASSLLGGAKFGIAGGTVVLVGYFLATLLGGLLLYRFVETPAMCLFARPCRVRTPRPEGRMNEDVPQRHR